VSDFHLVVEIGEVSYNKVLEVFVIDNQLQVLLKVLIIDHF
jgi:hypothetical protein